MLEKTQRLICSWAGTGFLPWAPGTCGSIAAVLIYILFLQSSGLVLSMVFLVTLLIGFYATQQILKTSRIQDPGWIVVDEVLGQWVTLAALTLTHSQSWLGYLAALALFRFFDIKKPWGIRKIENLSGAAGVIGDDLLAGFYGFVILLAVCAIF